MPIYKRNQRKKTISKEQFEEFLNDRDLERIIVFENYVFNFSGNENDFSYIEHIWSRGDRLYKLAHQYYDDKELFWVISLFNKKPTDGDYKYGDIVYIPANLSDFLREIRR